MQFFSALTFSTAVVSSASLFANANPIKRQAGQTVTITDLSVEILRGDFADATTFTIETGSEIITCGADTIRPLPTACNSDQSWIFVLVSDEANDAVNLTISAEIDGSTISGETAITLYCRGVPGAAVETEECVSLAAVSTGIPTVITLE